MSFRRTTILTVAALLLISVTVFSQQRGRVRRSNPSYRQGDWVTYSVASYVTSVAVGPDFVYFGTTGGITRYNHWRDAWADPFTVSDGLADDFVTAVAFDRTTGFLWAATRSAVSYYHPTEQVWRNLFKEELGISPRDDVQSIGIAANYIILETQANKRVTLDKYGGGRVLPADNGNPGAEGSVQWFGAHQRIPQRFPIFFTRPGLIFDPAGFIEDNMLRRSRISAYVDDGQGRAWIGTWGFGAGRIDLRSDRLEILDFGLLSPDVRAVAFDGGELWIGGFRSPTAPTRHGVTRWDIDRQRWRYYESPFISRLRSDQVNTIAVDDGWVWLGTDAGLAGYSKKNDDWITLDTFRGLARNRIFDVEADDQYVWVASGSGIDRITKSTLGSDSLHVVHILPSQLRDVGVYDLTLMRNLVWAGTDLGVFVYDNSKGVGGYENAPHGPGTQVVTAVHRYESEIWVGTSRGVEVYDTISRKWLGVPEKLFYATAPVNAIDADSRVVWVGTQKGALKYDRQRKYWRLYTVYDGLADNRVQAVLLDGDYVWFGTPNGLTKFYWNNPDRGD